MSRVKLGDVAIEHKESLKTYKDNLPIVGLEHLIPMQIKLTKYDVNVDTTFTKMFRKGNVLFGRRRAYLKKAVFAEFDGICSGDIIVIEALPDKILPELLPFIIQNDKLFEYAVAQSAGSLSPRVKWEQLKKFEFELPEIEKQKQLADLLWSIEDSKQSYQNLLSLTDELVKSQFIEMISNREKTLKLRDVCENNIVNASKLFNKDSEINYVEISSIDGVNKKIVSPTKIKYKDAPSSAKYVLELGDVLVSLVRPNLKKITINDLEENNVVGTSGFCVLRANTKISPEIIRTIVTTDHFTNKMIDCATGSTYPTIKDSDILDYSICEFNEEEVCSLTKLVKQSDKSKIIKQRCFYTFSEVNNYAKI